MYFLIGVIVLIIFLLFVYIYFKNKISSIFLKYFGTTDLKIFIEQAELEDQVTPKSLSSMDSVYLEQIRRDFPNVNINELKRMAEKVLLDCYHAIESKDSSNIKNNKIKSFVNSMISDLGSDTVKYDDFRIHKTVISGYENKNGIATIYLSSSYEYYYKRGDIINKKVQDRCRYEFIYVVDVDKVSVDYKSLGLNCPNCGSPIKSLGNKSCSYCGSGVVDIVSKSWNCNDIVIY